MTLEEVEKYIKLAFPTASNTDVRASIDFAGNRLLKEDEYLFWIRVREYMKKLSRKPYAIK